MEDALLFTRTTHDVAVRYHVTERTVRNWCARGRLPAHKVGGVWRIAAVNSIPQAYKPPRAKQPPGQGSDRTAQRGENVGFA